MTVERKSLAAMFGGVGGGFESAKAAWDATEAADEYAPLPRGVYTCKLESGELFESRNGTPGYKLTFVVLEGEHAGRKFWYDVWLSVKARPIAKRDLTKIGITSLTQLEQPIPRGYRCSLKVALRKDDDEIERNEVRSFEVIGRDEPQADAFAPKAEGAAS